MHSDFAEMQEATSNSVLEISSPILAVCMRSPGYINTLTTSTSTQEVMRYMFRH